MKILWIVRQDLSCYIFLRSVHTFSWFLKSNWSSDFGHAETEWSEKRVVLRREMFSLYFWSRERKRCSNKNSLSRWWFFVHMQQFHLDFHCFFDFLDRIFFSNWFSQSVIVRSRPSFVFEPNLHFSLAVFGSYIGISLWFLLFFRFLYLIFFLNGAPNSLIGRSGSSFFVKSMKILCIERQDLFCYVSLFRQEFCYEHMTSQPLQICFLFIRSWNFVHVSQGVQPCADSSWYVFDTGYCLL